MEIPELIIALELKMKVKAEDIKEKDRKIEMEKHDYNNYQKEIDRIKSISYKE